MLEAKEKVGGLAANDKVREGYEAAVIRRMKESGFLEVEIRVECLTRCGESYDDPVIAAGWHYWQESRIALMSDLVLQERLRGGVGMNLAAPAGDGSFRDSLLSYDDCQFLMGVKLAGELAALAPKNVVSVVVGGGVYRDRSAATHLRVWDLGDQGSPDQRHVEAVKALLYTESPDIGREARGLANEIKKIPGGAVVLVDESGLGTQFAELLRQSGLTVIPVLWGRQPESVEHKKRFFNLRAQCTVATADAIRDRRLVLSFHDFHKQVVQEQASYVPYWLDSEQRYHLESFEQSRKTGRLTSDLFDTVCMAFLEGVV